MNLDHIAMPTGDDFRQKGIGAGPKALDSQDIRRPAPMRACWKGLLDCLRPVGFEDLVTAVGGS